MAMFAEPCTCAFGKSQNARLLLFAECVQNNPNFLKIVTELVPDRRVREVINSRREIDNFYELKDSHSATFKIKDGDRIRVDVASDGCYKLVQGIAKQNRCITYAHGGESLHFVDVLEENKVLGRREYLYIDYRQDNKSNELIHEARIGPTPVIKDTILPALKHQNDMRIFGRQSLCIFSHHVPKNKIALIGRYLGVEDEDIYELEVGYRNDNVEWMYQILRRWMQKETPNIRRFTYALTLADLGSLANVAENAFRHGIAMDKSHFRHL